MGIADFLVVLWRRRRIGINAADRTVVAQVDDRSKAPLASPGDAGRTVALLLAVPEVTSLSELAGKNIAIDEAASASNDEARRKVEATVNAKLAEGRAKALDRLVNGEVSAAVLTLAYPETAEWSAEIAGFKVFRIPLVDRPLMAGLAPADPAVSDTQSARIPLSLPSSEARAEVVDPAACVRRQKGARADAGRDCHRGARDDAAGCREESVSLAEQRRAVGRDCRGWPGNQVGIRPHRKNHRDRRQVFELARQDSSRDRVGGGD